MKDLLDFKEIVEKYIQEEIISFNVYSFNVHIIKDNCRAYSANYVIDLIDRSIICKCKNNSKCNIKIEL